MAAALPPRLHSWTQPHLVTTQCSHSFAFLAAEQLCWSSWRFSASSKGTSAVAAAGWENITHSFKAASPGACLSNLHTRHNPSSVVVCRQFNHVTSTNLCTRLDDLMRHRAKYIKFGATVTFVEAVSVTAVQNDKCGGGGGGGGCWWRLPKHLHACSPPRLFTEGDTA